MTNQVKRYNSGYRVVIEPLQELGHEVLWAANFSGFIGDVAEIPCEYCQIDIRRNPLSLENIHAYKTLVALIADRHIDAVYCSTPIGGLLGRLAGRAERIGKVIFAAHGFVFYRGAPWWWNLVFRCEEKVLAHFTDVLITINDEDMAAAQKLKLRKGGHVYQIGGAGIEEQYAINKTKSQMRSEFCLPDDATVLVSAGALNKNKNYGPVIEALAELHDDKLYYLICGDGFLRDELQKKIATYGLEEHVLLLGYRTDVLDVMGCADMFVLSSFREGLPRATMEAMALGLPCIVSDSRGNRDLIKNGENGFVCAVDSVKQYAAAISALAESPELRSDMGRKNALGGVLHQHTTSVVYQQLLDIFAAELGRVSGDEGIDGNEPGADVCPGISEHNPAADRTGPRGSMGG